MIIDIEGTDGCGKRTQTMLLKEFLEAKGKKVKLISFPNYDSNSSAAVKMYLNGEIGLTGKDCLDGYQTSTLYAVDRLITMSKINVSDYDYVLFDRYVPSNMIHQSTKVKDPVALDCFLEWLEEFEYGKLKLPKPDKIVFLDMPVEVSTKLAIARGEYKSGTQKDILEQDDQHLKLAYERAKYVAEKFDWITINCVDKELKTIEEIHKEILTKLRF